MADSLEHPVHPFIAILGGAKIADKLNVINNLLDKCDALIIGGGMAYTFLKAQGGKEGLSLVDDENSNIAKICLTKRKSSARKFIFPSTAQSFRRSPIPSTHP